MLDAIRIVLLVVITFLCVFKIADGDPRRTPWDEGVGYLLAGIGGFWGAMVYGHWLVSDVYWWNVHDDVAAILFLAGIGLILRRAICHGFNRRASDPDPKAVKIGEAGPKMVAARFVRKVR